MGAHLDVAAGLAGDRGRRLSSSLERYLLPLGLGLYVLANFLPLSGKATNNVFYLFCAVPALIWASLNVRLILREARCFWLFWCFLLAYAVVGALHAQAVSPKPVLYIALLFFAVRAVRQPGNQQLNVLFAGLALLSLAALLMCSLRWLQALSVQGDVARIVLWDDHNPLRTSMLIATAIAWFWVFHLDAYSRQRGVVLHSLAFFATLLLLAWCAVVFQARSTLVGASAFVLLARVTRRAPPFLLFACGLATLVLLAWLMGWHEVLAERGLSYRLDIWQDAWQHVSQVCGLAFGCGEDKYLFLEKFTHPHSAYWSILYRHGAVVFVLFVCCALIWLVQGLLWRSGWLLVAALGWGSVLTTTGGVINSPSPYWIYFWIPTFLAMLEWRDAAAGRRVV